ncbi:XdhC family protein [Glacieibacterium megasporae]|uniref:XdhC family protein n=1 Tax=Glacieibacterium megasporae TaxID=2835787 RepID=UPI001C1E798E|nr:XdhC family protein [Polymorphobacter megasporae]UAJ08845.1 XdhC family protein [Polymorphobacter megasporae]
MTAGDDLDRVLTAARDWRAAGHGVALATVIDTWGSAPRRVGSHLAVRNDGLFEGSVSGGCVEGDVITEAIDLIASGGFKRLDYGVADATAWEVGLACGGKISVLVQAVTDARFAPGLIERLIEARAAGTAVTLATDLASGTTVEIERAGESAADTFAYAYAPPLRLAVIGAVHIAQTLVPIARLLGYAPLVIDPRGLFAKDARFDGITLDDGWPDEALTRWRPNAASAVVALSHDPKLDDVALAAALRSEAFYIAALGSRKNHASRLERLAAQGFGEATLARVRGPAGLDIGAANPAEIALSIAAQMTAAWRGRLPLAAPVQGI